MRVWTIFIVALSFIFHQTNAADADVSEPWCQCTLDWDLCLNIIGADPRYYLKTSPEGLCRIIVDKAALVSRANMEKISDLLKTSTGSYNQEALFACYQYYDQALPYLRAVDLSVINPSTYTYQNKDIARSSQAASVCEFGFKRRSSPSPLTNENQQLERIIYTVLEIINFKVCAKIEAC